MWNDEAPRKSLLEIFNALGPTDDLAIEGRKNYPQFYLANMSSLYKYKKIEDIPNKISIFPLNGALKLKRSLIFLNLDI